MTKKPKQDSPFVEKNTKSSDIEQHALTAIFVFLLFSRHDKTQLRRKVAATKKKGCRKENTQFRTYM